MKKIFLLMLAAGMMALTSCDLDINENPNFPSSSSITADLMFPAVENSIADVLGDQMFNYGGYFAQYFEQAPTANQYNTLAELNIDEVPTSSTVATACSMLAHLPTSKTL